MLTAQPLDTTPAPDPVGGRERLRIDSVIVFSSEGEIHFGVGSHLDIFWCGIM